MSPDLRLIDESLSAAMGSLTGAALVVERESSRPPLGELRGLTDLGATLDEFLYAVDTASRVLAEAARSAATDLGTLRSRADAADSGLFAALAKSGRAAVGS